jgi:hypothetical protein
MADGDRHTLVVALAGITATALVGLAGTAASWLSARDDRATQRELAREQRTYTDRVSAYIDAIDFIEGQKTSFQRFRDTECSALKCPNYGKTPIQADPPPKLVSRLRVFGSEKIFREFEKAEAARPQPEIEYGTVHGRPVELLLASDPGRYPWRCRKTGPGGTSCDELPWFYRPLNAFSEEIVRFEHMVNSEVG